jgi:hypothetical protein
LNSFKIKLKPQKSTNHTRIAAIFTGNDSEKQIRPLKNITMPTKLHEISFFEEFYKEFQ